MPRAPRSLPERRDDHAAHQTGGAGRVFGQDRVALVRHRRRALLAGREIFLRLQHLGALEMTDLRGRSIDGRRRRRVAKNMAWRSRGITWVETGSTVSPSSRRRAPRRAGRCWREGADGARRWRGRDLGGHWAGAVAPSPAPSAPSPTSTRASGLTSPRRWASPSVVSTQVIPRDRRHVLRHPRRRRLVDPSASRWRSVISSAPRVLEAEVFSPGQKGSSAMPESLWS